MARSARCAMIRASRSSCRTGGSRDEDKTRTTLRVFIHDELVAACARSRMSVAVTLVSDVQHGINVISQARPPPHTPPMYFNPHIRNMHSPHSPDLTKQYV